MWTQKDGQCRHEISPFIKISIKIWEYWWCVTNLKGIKVLVSKRKQKLGNFGIWNEIRESGLILHLYAGIVNNTLTYAHKSIFHFSNLGNIPDNKHGQVDLVSKLQVCQSLYAAKYFRLRDRIVHHDQFAVHLSPHHGRHGECFAFFRHCTLPMLFSSLHTHHAFAEMDTRNQYEEWAQLGNYATSINTAVAMRVIKSNKINQIL